MRRVQQQMKVVRHHAVRVQPPAEPFDRSRDQTDEGLGVVGHAGRRRSVACRPHGNRRGRSAPGSERAADEASGERSRGGNAPPRTALNCFNRHGPLSRFRGQTPEAARRDVAARVSAACLRAPPRRCAGLLDHRAELPTTPSVSPSSTRRSSSGQLVLEPLAVDRGAAGAHDLRVRGRADVLALVPQLLVQLLAGARADEHDRDLLLGAAGELDHLPGEVDDLAPARPCRARRPGRCRPSRRPARRARTPPGSS